MKFRHELKHRISYADAIVLRSRLQSFMKPDFNAIDGKYEIRSLYFDTPGDRALWEKINGVNLREKFRLRLYNFDTSLIKLEKKSKINGLCHKLSMTIPFDEAEALSCGKYGRITKETPKLLAELYSKMSSTALKPKTIVDYTREAYIFPPGNVRVTIDSGIRTGLSCTDFLNTDCVTIPTPDSPIILEVKWDEFFPSVIRDALQLDSRFASAFSKYAACRIYG